MFLYTNYRPEEMAALESRKYSSPGQSYYNYKMDVPLQVEYISMRPDDPLEHFTMVSIIPEHIYHVALTKEEVGSLFVKTRLHRHSYYELAFVLSGNLYYNIENRRHLYTPGSCCLLNRNVMHMEEHDTDFDVMFLGISDEVLRDVYRDLTEGFFTVEQNRPDTDLDRFLKENLFAEHTSYDKQYVEFIPSEVKDWDDTPDGVSSHPGLLHSQQSADRIREFACANSLRGASADADASEEEDAAPALDEEEVRRRIRSSAAASLIDFDRYISTQSSARFLSTGRNAAAAPSPKSGPGKSPAPDPALSPDIGGPDRTVPDPEQSTDMSDPRPDDVVFSRNPAVLLVRSTFNTIQDELLYPSIGSTHRIKALIARLLHTLSDPTYYETTPIQIGTDAENLLYNEIDRIMHDTLGRASRGFLEEELHYSGDYLNKITKKYTGLSIHDYGMTICMGIAAEELLNTDHSISDIAASLGFSNRTHFYKQFDKVYHLSPAEYRSSYRNELK